MRDKVEGFVVVRKVRRIGHPEGDPPLGIEPAAAGEVGVGTYWVGRKPRG